MKQKIVWKFTNKRELTASEFVRYFEKKVFATIRKFGMLPGDRIFKLSGTGINFSVLKHILQKKFEVKKGKDFSSENLSQIAEEIFENVLKGKFNIKGLKPEELKAPLYFLSDAEVEVYASLCKIKGRKRKRNKKIQLLFSRFMKKNPDLERCVVKGWGQMK